MGGQCKFSADAPRHWRHWFPIWHRLVTTYCDATDCRDAPFFHTERANVGLLAAAAWQSGLIALEEYATRRGISRKNTSGRADLWVASQGETISEVFEAKRMYFGNAESEQRLRDLFKDAKRQVKAIREPYYGSRGVLVFCVLCATGTPGQALTKEAINHLGRVRRFAEGVQAEAVAWCLPGGLQKADPEAKRSHVYHPGVVLLAKRIASSQDARRRAGRTTRQWS